jgi:hypothetical protein
MSWSAGMMNPTVVRGDVVTNAINYKLAATQTFKAGELIRLTSAGTVKVAALDTDTDGAVHGIALADAADYTAGDVFPVALFNQDTVVAIQLASGKDQADVAVGEISILAVASNHWTYADTAAKGIARIVGLPSQDEWFNSEMATSEDMAPVYVQFPNSVLQGRAA